MLRIMAHALLVVLLVLVALSSACTAQSVAAEDMVRVTSQAGMEIHPAWSGDGREILFVSDKGGGLVICKTDDSGKGEISQLTKVPSPLMSDIWIDSNQSAGRIIFASTRGSCSCQLYTMSADDSNPVLLNTPTTIAQYPSWSPDGKQVAFSSYDEGRSWWVWTANADGSGAKKLVQGIHPRWSPDGKRIAYSSNATTKAASGYDFYVINASGTGVKRLTSGKQNELEPDWSPDGKSIAYVSSGDTLVLPVFTATSARGARDIFVTPVSESVQGSIKLTDGSSANLHPRWSPDGKRIAFASDRSGNWDVWYMTLREKQ